MLSTTFPWGSPLPGLILYAVVHEEYPNDVAIGNMVSNGRSRKERLHEGGLTNLVVLLEESVE